MVYSSRPEAWNKPKVRRLLEVLVEVMHEMRGRMFVRIRGKVGGFPIVLSEQIRGSFVATDGD